MIEKKHILFLFLLLSGLNGFSQIDQIPFRVWQLTSFSGQATVRGNYRTSESILGDFKTKQSDAFMNGILRVNTQSYFVHPNFMVLNLNGIYNPETRRNTYIGAPDYSEKNNNEGFDASAVFFQKRNFNFFGNVSMYSGNQNIENITIVKSKTNVLGGGLSYNNKILPFSMSYSKETTEQKIIGQDRNFNMEQRIFQANANRSFTSFDHSAISYLHSENTSSQNDNGFAPQTTLINSDFYEFNNEISFDTKKNYTFNSAISKFDEWGNVAIHNISVQENLQLKLPENFIFSNSYNYRRTKQELNTLYDQGFQSSLSHRLYQSLNSRISFQHQQIDQSTYSEQRNRIGADLYYVKTIPNGRLSLTYSYSKEFHTVKTPSATLTILHEDYVLADNQITLLKNQNINIPSIVVKNVTGTIIYQLNLDYILVDRNPYIEIIRVPGGLISNNMTVYIDYTAVKPGLYEYVANSNAYSADVGLFNGKLNIYYRFFNQDFNNQVLNENQVLNFYTRHVVGFRLDFNYIKGGIEYEYYKSSLIPYQGMKYFIGYQKMYKDFYFTIDGNFTDFQMTNEEARRRDLDITSKIAYSVLKNLKADLGYSYRTMKGRGIDMEIHTTKLEMTATLHRLYFSIGTNFYWNRNLSSTYRFRGIYFQLTRNF